jgi:16S rRNA (guanine966-N2)-methyltransferase
MDPPYESDLARNAIEILSSCSYVTEETLIIVETSLESDFSDLEESGFEIVREKDYKTNRHLFIRKITEA